MSALNGNTVDRIGIQAPNWTPEELDNETVLHAADAPGDMRAVVYARTDGFGYGIETWNDAVGLTTYWTSAVLADAVAFADRVASA